VNIGFRYDMHDGIRAPSILVKAILLTGRRIVPSTKLQTAILKVVFMHKLPRAQQTSMIHLDIDRRTEALCQKVKTVTFRERRAQSKE